MIKKIIHQYNDRDSVYDDGLTNHLNMGLYALYQMGADEERLHRYAKSYIKKGHVPKVRTCDVIITDENFMDHLGKEGTYSAFIPFFKSEFEKGPFETVLRKYVNILIDGSAGGAFHGLIRLAYAYELESTDEMIKALSYFSEVYLKMGEKEYILGLNKKEPLEAVTELSRRTYFINKSFKRPMITGRMMDVFEDSQFENVVTGLPEVCQNSEAMNGLLLKLYGSTQNFTMLHGYTSTHALRVLEPLIDNYIEVIQRHWFNVQIAYLSTNCTPIMDTPSLNPNPKWTFIMRAVLEKVDVHAIKMTYSLYEQSKIYGEDELARRLASIKLYKSN